MSSGERAGKKAAVVCISIICHLIEINIGAVIASRRSLLFSFPWFLLPTLDSVSLSRFAAREQIEKRAMAAMTPKMIRMLERKC